MRACLRAYVCVCVRLPSWYKQSSTVSKRTVNSPRLEVGWAINISPPRPPKAKEREQHRDCVDKVMDRPVSLLKQHLVCGLSSGVVHRHDQNLLPWF